MPNELMRTYHIGLEDAGNRPYGYPAKRGLLVVHAVKNVDLLPPHIWKYLGEHQTTKAELRRKITGNIPGFLAFVTGLTGRTFTAVTVV